MKRKLLVVFLTAIMLVTLFPAASFAAGGQNDSEKLWWFYGDDIKLDGNKIVEYEGETNPQNFNAQDTIIVKGQFTSAYGYFALKSNDEYFVITGVSEVSEKGFKITESESQDGGYYITRKEFGTYLIEIEYNGKSYSINLENNLPDVGFYSSASRSSDTLIEDEFRFADKVEDGSDEAYFYLIYKAERESVQTPNVSIYTTKDIGNKKGIAGITIGAANKRTLDSETLYIYRITVDKRYTGDEEIYVGVENGLWDFSNHIRIYGSDEPATANMLYWIQPWDDIEIDNDGKISVSNATEEEYVFNPVYVNYHGKMKGYFAIKRNGNYYIADDVTLNSTDIKISKKEEGWYEIKADKVGKYKFTYGETYTLNLNVELLDTGFYSDETMSEESYLGEEFYYADAKLKNEDEASFYWITRYNYFDPDNAEFEIGKAPEPDEENIPEGIEGISFGKVTQETINDEKYCKCKITVSKNYRNNGNTLGIFVKCNNGSWWSEINIYDSTDPSKDQQMYWFEKEKVETDGNKIKFISNLDNLRCDLDEYASKNVIINYLEEYDGYFAVKKDGEYYVVNDNVKVANEGITVNELNDSIFSIENSKLGKFKVTGTYNGQTYAVNMFVNLPVSGFYSKPEKSAEAYLDREFRYDNAVSKSGNEAYFYLITRAYYDKDKDKIAIVERDEETGKLIKGNVNGVSLGDVVEQKIDGDRYYICKIIVSKEYRGKGDEILIGFESDNETEYFYDEYIRVYGATDETPAPVPGGSGGGGLIIPPQETKENVTTSTDIATSKKTTSTTVKDIKTETVKNEAGQSVSKTTASISKETAEKLVGQAVSNKVDTVEITVESNNTGKSDEAKSTEVAIPKSAVDSIANNTDAGMVIKTGAGQIALDNKALGTIASATGGDTVRIVINENTQLAESQTQSEDVIGSNGTIFDVAAYIGNTRVYDLKEGSADVMLPVPEKLKGKDIAVISISDKGICQVLNHSMETVGANSFVKFKTSQFINYAIVEKADADKYIENQNTDKVKALIKDAKFKVTTSKTSKKNIKVKVGVKTDKNLIKDIEDMGYTVKYKFYRSTKKTSKYSILKTKNTASYVNSSGKKGTKYYYKAKVLVYDGETLIAQTTLKQCSSGSRVWSK